MNLSTTETLQFVMMMITIIIIITIIIVIIVIMSDIMPLDKQQGQCHIIDIAVPGDACIKEKEKEKLEKYSDLRKKVVWLWHVDVTATNVVV